MDKTLHLLIMYTMLVLMLLLLQKGRNDRKSLYLAVYAFIEILTNGIDSISLWGGTAVYEWFPTLPFVAKPITLLWVPFFYFYVRTCFSQRFELKAKHLLHLLPFAMAMIFFLVMYVIRRGQMTTIKMFAFGSVEGYSIFVIDYIVRLQYIVYNVFMIIRLFKIEKKRKQNNTGVDLNVNIKWLRFIVYGYAIACFGAFIVYFSWYINGAFAAKLNIFSILYFFLFFFVIFYDTIVTKSFSSVLKIKQVQIPEQELNDIIKRLKIVLIENPLYLEADLSLKQVAEALNEKERSISQAINTIEKRNFKDYINELRIKHSLELLRNQHDKPIFEIMFESGFNTKGAFNTAFKKYVGLTPSEYRDSLD
ncbi:MAG: helix-turn-helix domain-containing protein [Prolixibacteraceae bacterium]